MSDPVNHDCYTTYTAFHNSGKRDVKDVKLIVMHDTEGGTAESIAEYFTSPGSGGSAHLVVDDDKCYRTLANDVTPWGAPGANVDGFHIEQVGYAAWTSAEWEKHEQLLHRAAYKAAYHAHLFKIPPVFVDAAGLKAGKAGITTHAEVSLAFPNDAGNHHDPGTGWPREKFMQLVRNYYNVLIRPQV